MRTPTIPRCDVCGDPIRAWESLCAKCTDWHALGVALEAWSARRRRSIADRELARLRARVRGLEDALIDAELVA